MTDQKVLEVYKDLSKKMESELEKGQTEEEPTATRVVDKFDDIPPETKAKPKTVGKKAALSKPPKKLSIDDLLKSPTGGVEVHQVPAPKASRASFSQRRNIISWVFDDTRKIMIITRADGSKAEFHDPMLLKKFALNDLEDMQKVGLVNPSKAINGQLAVQLLKEIFQKLHEKAEIKKVVSKIEEKQAAGMPTRRMSSIQKIKASAKGEDAEEMKAVPGGDVPGMPNVHIPPGDVQLPGTVINNPAGMYFTNGVTTMFLKTADIPKVKYVEALKLILKQVKDGEHSEAFREVLEPNILKKGKEIVDV